MVIALSRCHKAELAPDSGLMMIGYSGGKATVFDESSHALTHNIEGMGERDQRVHELGDQAFEAKFVAPPAPVFGGLGSIFNNVSCINCHRNDGGGFPSAGSPTSGLLMSISQAGTGSAWRCPMAIDGYGTQLQDQSVLRISGRSQVCQISYTETPFTYPDGSEASLRVPNLYFAKSLYAHSVYPTCFLPDLHHRSSAWDLLDDIPESTIEGFVDEGDQNGDGIIRKSEPWYMIGYTGETAVGRFGLKANTSPPCSCR